MNEQRSKILILAAAAALLAHAAAYLLLRDIAIFEDKIVEAEIASSAFEARPLQVVVSPSLRVMPVEPRPDAHNPEPQPPSQTTAPLISSQRLHSRPAIRASRLPSSIFGPVPSPLAIRARPSPTLPASEFPVPLPRRAEPVQLARAIATMELAAMELAAVAPVVAERVDAPTSTRAAPVETSRATLRAKGRLRRQLLASYPTSCERRGHEGTTVIRLTVGADGRARDLTVLQTAGCAKLDQAALSVLRKWRFEPASRKGVAIERAYDVENVWTLE